MKYSDAMKSLRLKFEGGSYIPPTVPITREEWKALKRGTIVILRLVIAQTICGLIILGFLIF